MYHFLTRLINLLYSCRQFLYVNLNTTGARHGECIFKTAIQTYPQFNCKMLLFMNSKITKIKKTIRICISFPSMYVCNIQIWDIRIQYMYHVHEKAVNRESSRIWVGKNTNKKSPEVIFLSLERCETVIRRRRTSSVSFNSPHFTKPKKNPKKPIHCK